jgi:hypothetical protein
LDIAEEPQNYSGRLVQTDNDQKKNKISLSLQAVFQNLYLFLINRLSEPETEVVMRQ